MMLLQQFRPEATRPYGVVVSDSNTPPATIGAALQQLRSDRRMSQRKLADLAQVDYGNISRYETGATGLNAETLEKILAAMDINLPALLVSGGLGAQEETVATVNYLRRQAEEAEERHAQRIATLEQEHELFKNQLFVLIEKLLVDEAGINPRKAIEMIQRVGKEMGVLGDFGSDAAEAIEQRTR